MDNIEQLKQDNAKLQERLNNAAKFFREQKAQIEALTKENEELKRTPKEEVIDTEKWNALATEKENLSKKVETLQSQFNQSNEEVKKVTSARDEWIEKCRKIEKDIESKDLYIKELQNTYNEVFAEKEKITKLFKEQQKFESEVINTKVPELEERLKNTEKAYKELQDKYKANDIAKGEAELKVENLQNEYTKKFEEQETQIETLKKKFEEEGQNAVTNKVLLDEANEKLDKLNKIYDDCENEKLAIQADYESLNNKYHTIELDMVNKDEIIKSYQEQLDNENILRFNKEDINNLCDYVLDFFKDKNINNEE